MSTIMKIICGLIIAAVVFADKIPTSKKPSSIPLIAFIVVVLAIGYIGQATGGIV